MKPTELPIFFDSDETHQLNELGIDSDLEDNDIRLLTFYQIALIAPYLEVGGAKIWVHTNIRQRVRVHLHDGVRSS